PERRLLRRADRIAATALADRGIRVGPLARARQTARGRPVRRDRGRRVNHQLLRVIADGPHNHGPDFGKASPVGLLVVVLLVMATSPYLRQHAHNPVHWQQWTPQALAEAAARDVPILLSIGYAACHWCHVMAHESFEDDEVAAVMNAGFVCIKVDREERPDID